VGQQQEEEQRHQHQDSGDQQVLAGAGMRVVDVLAGSAACRATALRNWAGAPSADQVFATHRNSLWPAPEPVLAVMLGLSCRFRSTLFLAKPRLPAIRAVVVQTLCTGTSYWLARWSGSLVTPRRGLIRIDIAVMDL
jgi:hypothetical protein